MPQDAMLAAAEYTTPAPWRALTTFGYFAALAATIGFVLTYVLAVRPMLPGREARGPGDAEVLRRRAGLLIAGGATLLLVSGYFQLAGRTTVASQGMSFGAGLAPSRIWAYLLMPAGQGAWISKGMVTLLHTVLVVLAAALLIPLFSPRVRRHLDRLAIAATPVVLLVSIIRSLPTDVDMLTLDEVTQAVLIQAHIVGGTLWVGGLGLLVLLAGTRSRLGPNAGLAWALTWQRFSTLALCAVGIVLISGLWLIWKEFGAVGQLFTTTFGLFLVVKLAFVVGLICAGAVNQFWLLPRIARRRRAGDLGSVWTLTLRHFPRLVTIETLLGIGVLAVVPFLVGSARNEAGDTGPQHLATPAVLGVGVVLVVMLTLSFFAAVKASEALGRTAESLGGTAEDRSEQLQA